MSAVSNVLKQVLLELQQLPSLSNFALAGGTNLALRFNHRKSVDIDLFCHDIIGVDGFSKIEKELKDYFGKTLLGLDYPCKVNDQYVFLRCFIQKEEETIKVEILQNMKFLYPVEIENNIRLVSFKDIGLFKLVSAASRSAKKDIYDLDYITDQIKLVDLYQDLSKKKKLFNAATDKTIFDLDDEDCPIKNPASLLAFDKSRNTMSSRPMHSNDRIDITPDGKTWQQARIRWRSKMRDLYRSLELNFPSIH